MIDVEALVYDALCGDSALVSLLGAESIYNVATDDAAVFPRIVFQKYLESDEDYADDAAQGTHVYVQLDVINRGADVEDIANQAESVMISNGFYHTTGRKEGSMNDQSRIIEKHIQFVIYVEEESN